MPSAGGPGGEPQKERDCGASWVKEGLSISTWDGVVWMCVDGCVWGCGAETFGPWSRLSKQTVTTGRPSREDCVDEEFILALSYVGDLGRVVDPRSSVDLDRTRSSTLPRRHTAVRGMGVDPLR